MSKLMIRQNLRIWLLKPWMLVVLASTAYGQDFTNNGGTITAQYSNPNGVENYPKLIDNDVTTKYYINQPSLWVQYQSAIAVVVTQYNITAANDEPSRDPKAWTLQGSNDGSAWTTLDTQTGQAFASRLLTKHYSFANTNAYAFFRLTITANNGASSTQFAELELRGSDLLPVDITNDGGTITAQHNNANANENYPKVIDNSTATKYYIAQSATWIQYQSTTPFVLEKYTITSANDQVSRDPKNWTLEGSNNGTTWTVIDTKSNQTFPTRFLTKTFFLPSNSASFTHYRLSITLNNGSSSTQLAEWELWGNNPSDNIPQAPTGLTATAVSSNAINLFWTDNASNETGFQIEISTNGTTFTTVANAGVNATGIPVSGLSAGTTYYFRVRASSTAGNSSYSNVVSTTTNPVGTPIPANVIATGNSASQITLSWTNTAGSQVVIERSIDGTTYTPIATTDVSATSYIDNSVSASTVYLYRVRAQNSAGSSAYVGPVVAATMAAPALPDITNNVGGIISDLYNRTGGEGNTKLVDNSIYSKYYTPNATGWIQFQAAASAVVTGYAITSGNDAIDRDPLNWTFQGSNDGATWQVLNTQTNQKFTNRQQTRAFSFSNTASYTHYRFVVTANNGASAWQLSEWQIFGTGGGTPDTSAPIVPTGLTATAVSGDQIVVTWTDNSITETGYQLEWSTNGGATWTSKTLKPNSTKFPHFGLSELTTYSYRVRATGQLSSSAYTSTVTSTTLSAAYPQTWKEHWFEHNQLLNKAYSNDDVGIYFDPDVVPAVTWMNQVVTDVWRYTKNVYGNFSSPKLYAIFHQNKYGGGNPSAYFDALRDYRNAICVGKNGDWTSNTDWNLDATVHEIGHIVEGASKGVRTSPAFALWGDSKWMEIYIYDVYHKLGWTAEAARGYNDNIGKVDNFPRAGTMWFKNWFYPIYNQYGETTVLNNFYTFMSQYFSQFNGEYTRNLNWGEFVHFWSGAAGVNLKAQATLAFGWPDLWELQFKQAQIDFPFTYGNAVPQVSARSAQSSSSTELAVSAVETKLTLWPNPVSNALNILLSGDEELGAVEIMTTTGSKTFMTHHLKGRMVTIDVSDLKPAMYTIKVVSKKGNVFTERIILNK
jgi:hypothetical protein